MNLKLDTTSPQAIYLQIVEQVRLQVARGELEAGCKLPSVREMALTLRINPNTVARAYRELEHDGVVVKQQGRGVFVADQTVTLPATERRSQLNPHLDALLVAAWRIGVTPDELVQQLGDRAQEFFAQKSPRARKR